jgi:hypothetical protein
MSAEERPPRRPPRRPVADPRDIPLIVLSFDRYADLWEPFFAFFWRHWPDCPFRVHLTTNFKSYADARVTVLQTGEEVSWAMRVARALEAVNSEYVLIVLEDFLVTKPVDSAEILRLGRVAIEEKVGHLRLAPNPPPSDPVPGHRDLGEVRAGDPYRITSQVAFWHTDTLLQYLDPGYSIWDFEFQGSVHGPPPQRPLWARWKPAIHYRHCVEKGQWLPWGIATCRRAGVPIERSARPAMRGATLWRLRYGTVRGFVFWRLPRSIQRRRWTRIVERESAKRAEAGRPTPTSAAARA